MKLNVLCVEGGVHISSSVNVAVAPQTEGCTKAAELKGTFRSDSGLLIGSWPSCSGPCLAGAGAVCPPGLRLHVNFLLRQLSLSAACA